MIAIVQNVKQNISNVMDVDVKKYLMIKPCVIIVKKNIVTIVTQVITMMIVTQVIVMMNVKKNKNKISTFV